MQRRGWKGESLTMWDYKEGEYIKVFRKIVNWEWYTDINTKVLFLHCLIRANWRPGRYKGREYKRGQFFASIDKLSRETGLTNRQVRTALKHLEMTNEVTRSDAGKYSLFTVASFDKYQGKRHEKRQEDDMETDMETDSKNDKVVTRQRQGSDMGYKNNKELYPTDIKEYKEDPVPPLGGPDGYGEPPDGWDDECERQFLEDAPQNPGKTRKDWWEFWKG
jgi:hypothetical protein